MFNLKYPNDSKFIVKLKSHYLKLQTILVFFAPVLGREGVYVTAVMEKVTPFMCAGIG